MMNNVRLENKISDGLIFSYTEFINGRCAEKNWYRGMETRHFRIESFLVIREQVKITQVLKFFLLSGAVDFSLSILR